MMKNILYYIFLVVVTVCETSQIFASNTSRIREVKGIPHNEINYLYEDRRGYMWIATLDGLFRYDGSKYLSYTQGSSKNAIGSNLTLTIKEDNRGNIWVGTFGCGISMLNPQTGEFTNYSLCELINDDLWVNYVGTIEVDKHDNIWIGNISGIIKAKLNPLNGLIEDAKAYRITKKEKRLNDLVNKIHEDRRGEIWIGSNRSLKRVIGENTDGLIYEYHDMSCMDICDYDDNSILTTAAVVRRVQRDSASGNYNVLSKILNERASDIVYRDNNIWIGGPDGVKQAKMDKNGQWHVMAHYNRENLPFSIASTYVLSLTATRDNQIWVGTKGGGAFTINRSLKPFRNYPSSGTGNDRSKTLGRSIVRSMYEDRQGTLWVATAEDGLYYLNKGRRYDSGFKSIKLNRGRDIISSIGESVSMNGDKQRHLIWLGLSYPEFLTSIDPSTHKIVEQPEELRKVGRALAFAQSSSNTLWVGTYNRGLWRLKLDSKGIVKKFECFKTSNQNDAIISNIIRSLYIDSKGNMWIGTDVGACRILADDINKTIPKFVKKLHCDGVDIEVNDYTLQIAESKQGEILIGTIGAGLVCYNPQHQTIKRVTKDDGLSNNTINTFLENRTNGDLWIATNNSISRYNPATQTIVNFNSDEGVEDNHFSEICGTIHRSTNDFIFGNSHGLVAFDPAAMPISQVTPKLYLTDLYLNHRLAKIGKGSVLTKRLEYTTEIELDYDDRNFAIGFVGINFLSPNGNKYLYKLDGVDKEWRTIYGDECIAQYTNIHEGSYTFMVRAANSDDVWSDEELSLSIKISPPLSRTTIAYIAYVVLILLLIYTIIHVVLIFARKSRELYITQIERDNSEKIMHNKIEAFMNISHEFRTPLTLMSVPLDKLALSLHHNSNDDQSGEQKKQYLREIQRNANILKHLINQFLEIRKIESDKDRVELRCVDANRFVKLYFDHFVTFANSKNINYTFHESDIVAPINVDTRLFDRVISNVISNSFKYTPLGGCISVLVECNIEMGKVVMKVTDNGAGVEASEIEHLFDYFYQANNTDSTKHQSSGIGLALCKKIVELHNGHIAIESALGEGFSVIITLPISQSNITNNFDEIEYPLFDEGEICSEPAPKIIKHDILILLVEDNVRLRNMLKEELCDEYNVVVAQNGEVGLEMCRKHKPHIVITDIMMPVKDGIEMCREIKADESISHTPILVLTGDDSVKNKIDSFTIGGADGYVEKPFNIEFLRCNIATILKNRAIIQNRFSKGAIVMPEELASSPADQKFMTHILAIIKRDMGDSQLNMERIASEYGVTRAYLNRKIKSLTGITSTNLLRNIRLKYAASLILQRNLTISEIAMTVGYTDMNTFRSRFKSRYGVLPSNYNGESPVDDDIDE